MNLEEQIKFLEARVNAMEKEIEKLNIEIINKDLEIQLLKDGIN